MFVEHLNIYFYSLNLSPMNVRTVLKELKALGDPEHLKGLAHFAIDDTNAYGVKMPFVRELAKKYKKNHVLAADLWQSGIHEARIMASLVDDPKEVTEAQMDAWVNDFNSWDVCDQCTGNLFDKTPFAHKKAIEWSMGEKEFVKRAGFAMMAYITIHDKKASNDDFIPFIKRIEEEAHDDRNFVKKAVNWALRQIGKQNRDLHKMAIDSAKRIAKQDSKSAKWIAVDALKELESEKVIERLG